MISFLMMPFLSSTLEFRRSQIEAEFGEFVEDPVARGVAPKRGLLSRNARAVLHARLV
jgi:hypothetical protein